MATAGIPPRAMPSAKRSATTASKLGAKGMTSPRTVAETTAMTMVRSRPHRSETTDHGRTPTARPKVAAETPREARAASIPRSAARRGSTPCTE